MSKLDRYINFIDFLWGNSMVNLNTIVYLSVILSYIVSSLYCSYPAYLLRQLRIHACDCSIPRVYTQRCRQLHNQVGYDTNNNITVRWHTKYAKHSFAKPETGSKSRRDNNAQVKAACILVDFIGSNI
jgi:hypothetical protein